MPVVVRVSVRGRRRLRGSCVNRPHRAIASSRHGRSSDRSPPTTSKPSSGESLAPFGERLRRRPSWNSIGATPHPLFDKSRLSRYASPPVPGRRRAAASTGTAYSLPTASKPRSAGTGSRVPEGWGNHRGAPRRAPGWRGPRALVVSIAVSPRAASTRAIESIPGYRRTSARAPPGRIMPGRLAPACRHPSG